MVAGEYTINESEPATNHTNVLLSVQYAFHYAREHVVKPDEANCQWTRSTYMIGLWEYYAATVDAKAPDLNAQSDLSVWGKGLSYKLCTGYGKWTGPCATQNA